MAKRESGTVSTRGIGVPKFNQEMLAATIAALAGITLVWTFSQPAFPVPVLIAAGAVFTVSIVMVIRLMMDPDSVRALQSDAMLQLDVYKRQVRVSCGPARAAPTAAWPRRW